MKTRSRRIYAEENPIGFLFKKENSPTPFAAKTTFKRVAANVPSAAKPHKKVIPIRKIKQKAGLNTLLKTGMASPAPLTNRSEMIAYPLKKRNLMIPA
ncbi:hypothetical protein [Caenibacillus caldisaponilyticus]|uniref:hypothetical protein n=1 Tax=Caenibacillus caldisaponilyticus TaxID=1674942 RepID=UPI0009884D5C|nr:hypothetical protein [Caenibacillus caldisaponilyticus]